MLRLLASLLIVASGTAVATPRVPVPRILCERPRALELRRFEDRSAQLLCRGRILVRVAVPG